ncbi:WecB/TagA/CpsF family glycosyltransferase, partial [Rhodospirillum rubrum]
LDRHIDRYRHRWRDRLKRRLKTLAVAVLGPQRIGAWQRRRLGPLTDRMLAQAAGSRQRLFGLPVDALTMTEAIDRAETAMRTRQRLRQADINVAKLVAMSGDRLLRADVAGSDMVCVDGMGVLWAARLLGVAIPERITGIDLMDHLLARAGRGGFRPYILGAEATVLDEAVASLRRRYPDLVFAGWHHGYFSPAEEPAVVAAIAASRADCLFVAMPSPAKEAFLARHHAALGVAYVMGVGGSIDVIAGKRWRAPRWMQRAGLEWLARLIQDPRHLGPRYLKSNSLFLGLVIKEWIRLRRGGAEDT